LKLTFRTITTASLMWVPPVTLTTIPLTELARIEAQPEPVPPSRTIALVIVTAPKPPGSSASISPPSAVFEIAPAQVLHGAVRLHGLASSPTPDTQVRLACARAVEQARTDNASMLTPGYSFFISDSSILV